MKSVILILLCAFVWEVSAQNIAVGINFGTAYVDPEELLEHSLLKELSTHGVVEVDVDRLHGLNNPVFEIEIMTSGEVDPNLKDFLETALTNLKFMGTTIKNDDNTNKLYSKFNVNTTRFYVNFDLNKFADEMEALAASAMKMSYTETDSTMN